MSRHSTISRRALLALTIAAATACSDASRSRGTANGGPDSTRGDSVPVQATSAPATTGLDSVLLAAAYERAASLPRLYSFIVARDGEVLAERYYNGRDADRRANIKSASKSVISALVGIAINEGDLEGIDQPIADAFAQDLPPQPDARMRRVSIVHLLSMQSGLEPTSFGNYGQWVSSRNWVRYVLARPFVDEPGGRMLYSTGSTHLLSALLTRATGQSTFAFAREHLFEPIGIQVTPWTTDPQGIYFGGNEMSLRPREMLVFGELYRNGGVHGGEQVVPRAWIEESWRPRTSSPYNGHGYGLGWWMRRAAGHDVFFAWGYGGQYIFIVPSLRLTMVTTSDALSPREGDHNRAIHDILATFIVPAAIRGSAAATGPAGP